MRKKLLTTATVLTTFMVTGGYVPQAFAQKARLLSPTTDWAVSKVATQRGSLPYCALAKRFSKNTILTLARNYKNEASFAVDFQHPVFAKAAPLKIILDPGAGQQRHFEVLPVSKKAVVVRMGQDETFFSALHRTGYLRAEIGTQSYSFNLSDIDAGQLRLDTCLASVLEPAAGEEEPAGFVQQAQAGVTIDTELKDQMRLLRAENQKLSDLLTQSAQKLAPIPENLTKRLHQLEVENEELRLGLERTKLQSSAGASVDISKFEAEIEALRAENERLKYVEANADDTKTRAVALESSLQAENKRLKEQLIVAQEDAQSLERRLQIGGDTTPTNVSVEELDFLKEENRSLKARLAGTSGNQSLAHDLKGQLSALKQKNQKLSRELEAAGEEDSSQLQAELEVLRDKNQELSEALDKQQPAQDVSAQLAELETLRGINQKNEAKLVQMSQYALELDSVKAKNKELQDALSGTQGARDALVTSLEAELTSLQTENENLRNAIAVEQATSVVDDQEAERYVALQVRFDQLKQDNETLRAQLSAGAQGSERSSEELQAALKKNDYLQAEIKMLKQESVLGSKEVVSLKQENEKLRQALAQANSGEAVEGLQAQFRDLQKQNLSLSSKLETALESAETYKKELAVRQAKVKSLQSENAELLIALNEKNQARPQQDQLLAMQNLTAENEKLKRQLQTTDYTTMPERRVASRAVDLTTPPEGVLPMAGEPESVLQPLPSQGSAQEDLQDRSSDRLISSVRRIRSPAARNDGISDAQRQESRLIDQIQGRLDVLGDDVAHMGDRDFFAGQSVKPVGKVAKIQSYEQERLSPAPRNVAQPSIPQGVRTISSDPSILRTVDPNRLRPMEAGYSDDAFIPMPGATEMRQVREDGSVDGGDINTQAEGIVEIPTEIVAGYRDASAYRSYQGHVQPREAVHRTPQPKTKTSEDQRLERYSLEAVESYPDEKTRAIRATSQRFDLKPLLGQANIAQSSINIVEGASDASKTVYQWKIGNVFGTAEQVTLSNAAAFDDNVREYLEKTQKRCQGDYAVVPVGTEDHNDTRLDSYEVACVGNGVSSAASLLFFNAQGTFSVVAHEAATDHMADAMDIRDRLLKTISGS